MVFTVWDSACVYKGGFKTIVHTETLNRKGLLELIIQRGLVSLYVDRLN